MKGRGSGDDDDGAGDVGDEDRESMSANGVESHAIGGLPYELREHRRRYWRAPKNYWSGEQNNS